MNPAVIQAGSQLAVGLAGLFIPGAGPAVSGLAALMAAIAELNKRKGRAPDYVPTLAELDAFIAEREGKRIPV